MSEFFGSIWWFIVALGLLVTFHEFGHFWVARRAGVRVLRFSVGFGKPLLRKIGKDGTEYTLAAIPLGGYVKMLDEREVDVPVSQRHESFNSKSVGTRMAIVAAGPVFNLVFALVAFWLMYLVGVPELRAVFAEPQPETIAAQAGIREADMITAVDGSDVETLTQASIAMLPFAIDRQPVAVTLEAAGGGKRTTTLAMDALGSDFEEEKMLEALGLQIWMPHLPATVGNVLDNEPAALAGFEAGDTVTAIEGTAVSDWTSLGEVIQQHAAPGKALTFTILRNGTQQSISATPATHEEREIFYIGVEPVEPDPEQIAIWRKMRPVISYGPVESVSGSLKETWRMTTATFGLIKRMLTGDASLKNLSGPISIAQFANDSAQGGLGRFLFFLGLLSLSLAILNFLPIPLLDGGHLLYFIVEWIKGSPVSESVQIAGQYVGLAALAGLISLTFYNDILRLLS